MRIIGRLNEKEMYKEGELLVSMSVDEFETLRRLFMRPEDNDRTSLEITATGAEAFLSFRLATQRAADALGITKIGDVK